MKTTTTITELTQNDLVNLLSTATYGSIWLESWTPADIREELDIEPGACVEDIQATALLAGKAIMVTDHQAEGEFYGDVCVAEKDTDEDDCSVSYRVTLDRIKEGIAAAFDGTFKGCTSATPDNDELEAAHEAAQSFLLDDGDFDNTRAEILMQIIMFNEIIY